MSATLSHLAAALDPVLPGEVDQKYLDEARQMQALSLAVHIPLVCFGIAFPAMVLFMEGLWLRTGDPLYKTIAKRWSKVMITLFAIGVVTGTILSFEFGLLWPEFMSTFGDVFGLAFGLEGFSFFLEAIFMTIYVYGWDRLPKRAHFMAGIPIVITGITGSLFVIAVNGWMNDPQGFDIVNGAVTNVRPFEALFGGHVWFEFTHMYFAGYIVCGFIVAAVYAFAWLNGKNDRYHRVAMIVPLAVVTIVAPAQMLVGDWAARSIAKDQPIKLAAFEGLEKTTKGAPFNLLGYYDNDTGEIKGGITIPDMLSLLAFHDPNATVTGLDAVPKDDRPPVDVVRYAFQFMVLIGTFLAAVAGFFGFVWFRKQRLPGSAWFYRAVIACAPLAFICLICGWIATEVGRQPWVVYEVMRTEQAVTGADGIPVGYATLALTYACLAAIAFVMLRRIARHPIEMEE